MEDFTISLKPDIIGNFFGLPVTTTLIASLFLSFVLVIFIFIFSRKISLVPSYFQLVIEMMVEGAYSYIEKVLGDKKIAQKVFPLVVSLFVFILFMNLVKFIPGTESLRYDGAQLLRPIHSDLNMTLALGIVSFVAIQLFGIFILGFWKYGAKFFDLKKFFYSFAQGPQAVCSCFWKNTFGLYRIYFRTCKISITFF